MVLIYYTTFYNSSVKQTDYRGSFITFQNKLPYMEQVKLINHILFLSIFIMLLQPGALFASSYDDDTLEIFSKIIPRFILMSSQKTTIQNKIEICILHDKLDERSASSLVDRIQNNYPNGIKNYKLKLINSDYADIELCRKSQLAFLFEIQ